METNETAYHPLVVELFDRLPFAGKMTPGPGVVSGSSGSAAVGAEVHFWIKCSGDRIQAISFQAYGCPHTIAAAAWVAQHARGMALADIRRRSWLDVERILGVPAEKRGRLLIVEDALKSAVRASHENV